VLPAGEEENDYAYNITIHVNVTGYEEGSTHLTEVKVFRINKNIQSEKSFSSSPAGSTKTSKYPFSDEEITSKLPKNNGKIHN
jgi:hypothetical protein